MYNFTRKTKVSSYKRSREKYDCHVFASQHVIEFNSVYNEILFTVEPRFNKVAGDRLNLFVKWRVHYIENLNITNLRGNSQNVRYIQVIVSD